MEAYLGTYYDFSYAPLRTYFYTNCRPLRELLQGPLEKLTSNCSVFILPKQEFPLGLIENKLSSYMDCLSTCAG